MHSSGGLERRRAKRGQPALIEQCHNCEPYPCSAVGLQLFLGASPNLAQRGAARAIRLTRLRLAFGDAGVGFP
jgi:hypothetical protein